MDSLEEVVPWSGSGGALRSTFRNWLRSVLESSFGKSSCFSYRFCYRDYLEDYLLNTHRAYLEDCSRGG